MTEVTNEALQSFQTISHVRAACLTRERAKRAHRTGFDGFCISGISNHAWLAPHLGDGGAGTEDRGSL